MTLFMVTVWYLDGSALISKSKHGFNNYPTKKKQKEKQAQFNYVKQMASIMKFTKAKKYLILVAMLIV